MEMARLRKCAASLRLTANRRRLLPNISKRIRPPQFDGAEPPFAISDAESELPMKRELTQVLWSE